jgi:hypothetical protein
MTATISPTCTISPTITVTATVSPTATLVFQAAGDLSRAVVYPNPWTEGQAHGKRWVAFIHLSPGAQIALYTLDGRKIRFLTSQDQTGRVQWDLTNQSGKAVAAGIYIYVITDSAGHKAMGKVAIALDYVF